MIWHIAKKEFRINLISARFIIALLPCLFLEVLTGNNVIYQVRKKLKT
jgi:hypothetical protein